MDNLTHTLFGVALANAGLKQRCGKGTTLALALASNLPDLDAIWAVAHGGGVHFLCRRSLTHSVLGAPLLAVALAWLLGFRYRQMPWKHRFGLCLIGVAGHVFLDLLNAFGVLLLFPFDRERYELCWVFIIDPWIWGLLAAPVLALLRPWGAARLISLSRAVLLGMALYLGLCALAHRRAETLLAARHPAARIRWALPEAFGPQGFRGIAREGDVWKLSRIRPFSGQVLAAGEEITRDEDPVVQRARATELGRFLDGFMKAPVWRRIPGEEAAEVYDLQFRTRVAPKGKEPFAFRVEAP